MLLLPNTYFKLSRKQFSTFDPYDWGKWSVTMPSGTKHEIVGSRPEQCVKPRFVKHVIDKDSVANINPLDKIYNPCLFFLRCLDIASKRFVQRINWYSHGAGQLPPKYGKAQIRATRMYAKAFGRFFVPSPFRRPITFLGLKGEML